MRRFFHRSLNDRQLNRFALNQGEYPTSNSSDLESSDVENEFGSLGSHLLSQRVDYSKRRAPRNRRRKRIHSGDGGESTQAARSLVGQRGERTMPLAGVRSRARPVITARQNQMYLITSLLPSQPDQALINRMLPKELFLRIFSFLDIVSLCRCAQVSRNWHILALDGSNWQQVDLFRFQKDIKAPVIENLAKRCGGFLKKLSLRGCENIQDCSLRSFTLKCPNIEQLSLYKCRRVTDSTCDFLGINCKKLKWLDLENCATITDNALKSISKGCKNLEYLNISWCDGVQDAGLLAVFENCPMLNTLLCRGCEGLSENMFANTHGYCKELRNLNLLGCFVVDETVADIAASCAQLEYLCLSVCSQITDRALISLANGCQKLKDIELAGCSMLSDHGFAMLAKNCHDLERMDLEDCSLITDITLDNFSKGCPRLFNLSLSHCELITDAGLRQLCLNNRLKDRLTILELDNCPQITDTCLEYMRQIRSLQRVDLYDCQNVTKDAIRRFKSSKPEVEVHAYFAPITPPPVTQPNRSTICRCCALL